MIWIVLGRFSGGVGSLIGGKRELGIVKIIWARLNKSAVRSGKLSSSIASVEVLLSALKELGISCSFSNVHPENPRLNLSSSIRMSGPVPVLGRRVGAAKPALTLEVIEGSSDRYAIVDRPSARDKLTMGEVMVSAIAKN